MRALLERGYEMAQGGYPWIRQTVQEVAAAENIVGTSGSPLRPH